MAGPQHLTSAPGTFGPVDARRHLAQLVTVEGGWSAHAWYAVDDHPAGVAASPFFEVIGSMVYPGAGHPTGASSRPWYQLRNEHAFPVDGHPHGPASDPEFRVEGDHVYPIDAWSGAGAPVPWFVVRELPQ